MFGWWLVLEECVLMGVLPGVSPGVSVRGEGGVTSEVSIFKR